MVIETTKMKEERIGMTQKDVSRAGIMAQVEEGKISQQQAAEDLKLSDRQIRRLYKKYKKDGVKGIVSQKKGGNRKHSQAFKQNVLEKVKVHYYDFKPTFAAEKLEERDGLNINRETLRQWMQEEGLWKGKKRRKARIHQSRERRPCVGELIQIDGSHHDWFEGRSEKCCLLVFIDDATSRLMELRFEPSETTLGYFSCMKSYIKKYGAPVAFYSDKDSVFIVNKPNVLDDNRGQTQFQRAIKSLGIELICAHSPQAKGRVEKANGTLQDRLIKEMRLNDIHTMEDANTYLPKFMKHYNKRFAKQPVGSVDKHKPVYFTQEQLDRLLSIQTIRTLSKNLELSYKNTIYKIKRPGMGYAFRGAKVIVCEHMNGDISIMRHNEILKYKTIGKTRQAVTFADSKDINQKVGEILTSIVTCENVENASRLHTI